MPEQLLQTITNPLTNPLTIKTNNPILAENPQNNSEVMQQLLQKIDYINNITKKTYESSVLAQERSKRTTMQLVNDLTIKIFDPNKDYGGIYITGKVILIIVIGIPLILFSIIIRLIIIIFYVILFLLIFIPLLIIGIALYILILVLIKVYTYGKKFSDALIQVLNSIIPPPLKAWNSFAGGINSMARGLRKIGIRMPRAPTVRNPNAYKIKKGALSIYDIIGLVTKPMKESANRRFEKALN